MVNRICAMAVLGSLLVIAHASAEVVRLRYGPADACGNFALIPGPSGAPGERAAWIGGVYEPYPGQITPTHIVTFRHAYTGQNVNVPIIFPIGTPRVERRADRVIYNYSTYQIHTHFLADGTVEVIYNSGALRPIAFQ